MSVCIVSVLPWCNYLAEQSGMIDSTERDMTYAHYKYKDKYLF